MIERVGPGITKLRSGAKVKLQFFPPEPRNVKGKGKAADTEADSESDSDEQQ